MFCNKCGKQLPDNATFCSGCGNQVGAASNAAPNTSANTAAPAEIPVIFKRLVSQFLNFFTKKDPIGVVANSARDNSYSGIFVAVFGMLMMALGTMVNINQGMLSYAKGIYADYWSSETAKYIAEKYPSGASFGMTLLAVAVVFVASVVILFVASNYIGKKPLSLSGACNIVAYASIPMICASILNMLLGLIWFVLPVVVMMLACVATLVIAFCAYNKANTYDKPLTVNLTAFAVIAVVAWLFCWIALKSINEAKDSGAVISCIANWFK